MPITLPTATHPHGKREKKNVFSRMESLRRAFLQMSALILNIIRDLNIEQSEFSQEVREYNDPLRTAEGENGSLWNYEFSLALKIRVMESIYRKEFRDFPLLPSCTPISCLLRFSTGLYIYR